MKFVMTLIAATLVASPAMAQLDGAKLFAEKTCNTAPRLTSRSCRTTRNWPGRTPPTPNSR